MILQFLKRLSSYIWIRSIKPFDALRGSEEYKELLSIRAAKGQTTLCKTRRFAGQTGNVRAENIFAALILIGCRDVKQLRSANEILRIPFQCQSWREFLWMSLHLLTL